ncbi:glycosyltransferase family 4 protein [Arthrobacter pigmenti]
MLTLVVPAGFDTVITGGNIYDRRLVQALRGAGDDVGVVAVAGNWPSPDRAERRELAAALRQATGTLIIDGLIASGCPDVVENLAAAGADVRVLVHMPLALDPALDLAAAARLDDMERRTLQAAGGVISTSRWAAAEVRRRHQVESAVAEPGVDPAPPADGSVPPRIVQVGTIGALKNQLTTVTALAKLTRFDWSARLVGPVGDSDYAGAVDEAIRDAGLEHRILMSGQLTGPELARQWDEADISVLPSRTETYGMVVAESLAHAVPALVSAGTGAEHTLGWDSTGNRPGFVVDTATAEPLTAALADWLGDKDLRRRVKAAAEDRRTMLTGWERTAAAVLKTLQ